MTGEKKYANKLDDLATRRINRIAIWQCWDNNPSERCLYRLLVDYNADGEIAKVTLQFPNLPEDAIVSTNGVYDTYEYSGRLLIKHRLFRRANSPTGPVTLSEYYLYNYGTNGQLQTITRYVNRQLSPGGASGFNAATVYRYSYTADNRINEVKAYSLDRGEEESVEKRHVSRIQYQYNQGNVSKQTHYCMDYKTEKKKSETRYTRYDDRTNPLYFPGHLTPGLLPVSLSVNNALAVSHVGFDNGQAISDAVSTKHYEWVYDDNHYPTRMKEIRINRHIFLTARQTYGIQTQHGVSEVVFTYHELNNE